MIRTTSLGLAAAGLAVALLAGCGGGGDSGSTQTFALQAGYKKLIATGYTVNFAVSGDCSGTATQTNSKPAAASFEGNAAAQATTSTQTLNFTDCTPATTTATVIDYFDANLAALGSSTAAEYGVFQTPATLPVAVRIGDTGPFGTEQIFTDSSKATPIGRDDLTYSIAADTGSTTTAIGTLTTKSYDEQNTLILTQTSRYRIAAEGTLTLLSVEVQYSPPNPLHLLLTPQ